MLYSINFQPPEITVCSSGFHHSLACLRPGVHLHDQSSDYGPHEGRVKAVDEELKKVYQEVEEVCQGICGGRSSKVQGGLAKEDLTQAGALSTLHYPYC